MANEPVAASLASRLTGTEQQLTPEGYFRSKLFVSTSTSNQLVAAANPILSLLDRINISPNLPLVNTLREKIEHELHAFHCRLNSVDYAQEFTAIANYLLSATIDELLGKNYIRLYGQPAEFKSFTPSSEYEPHKHFFTIIKHLQEQSHHYLDLLELAYYCLIVGFEGEYHLSIDGRQQLESWIDELHNLIQNHRVHKPYRLFVEPILNKPTRTYRKPIIITAICTVAVLTIIYCASYLTLDYKAQKIIEKNNALLANMEHEWINH
jgi:type VI secretion system protein ImpK